MKKNTKNNIRRFWTHNIFYLAGYAVFLIAGVSSYNAGNNLLAFINLFIALVFLIFFAVITNLAKDSFKKYREKLRKHFREIIQIKDSPHAIATGFAIGTAIAILPTFGLGAIIGLGIALIFKKVSKISLFAAFLVWNPFILAPLTLLEYEIGNFLLRGDSILIHNLEFLEILTHYSKTYLLGNIIVTIILSSLSYVIIYLLVNKHQEKYKKFIKEPLEQVIETVEEKVVKIDEKIQEKVEECKEVCEKIIESK